MANRQRSRPAMVVPNEDRPTHPWWFRCPECGIWGRITQEQYEGTSSIDHTDAITGCTFHRNFDCRLLDIDKAIALAMAEHLAPKRADAAFMERLRRRVEQDKPILDRLGDS